jgi:2-polyprenyl-3-methyl-5-hydroxy-6-metoxy-1,4-benzoquinol methylase
MAHRIISRRGTTKDQHAENPVRSVCIAARAARLRHFVRDGTVSARDYCLVKVRSSAASKASVLYVGSAGGNIAKVAVEELLAPRLIGQDRCGSRDYGRRCIRNRCCRAARAA